MICLNARSGRDMFDDGTSHPLYSCYCVGLTCGENMCLDYKPTNFSTILGSKKLDPTLYARTDRTNREARAALIFSHKSFKSSIISRAGMSIRQITKEKKM